MDRPSHIATAPYSGAQLEEQLRAPGEVRGRVEIIGIVPLLHVVAASRPNARIHVRDASSLFEIDLRNGTHLSLTRTASDGSFARGEGAFVQLCELRSGHFQVAYADGPLRAALAAPLHQAIANAAPHPSQAPALVSVPPRASERREGLVLVLLLAACMALGYFGWRRLEADARERDHPSPLHLTPLAATPPRAPDEIASDERGDPSPEPRAGAPHEAGFARVIPFIDKSRGVDVGPEEGLLVIEYEGSTHAPLVRVGSHDLGEPPIAMALPPGRHEIALRRGKHTSFRYLVMRAGETRVVALSE